MRVSLQWLGAYLDSGLSAAAIGERLTMGGLEVEGTEAAAPAFHGVRTGHVLSVEPHPAAERLCVALVEAGDKVPLQIVCGAANLRTGQKVCVATAGALLPGGVAIAESELRGVRSQGMLCSAAELGLEDGSSGLLELDPEVPAGLDLRAWLGLDDQVLTLGITPNRGDALSLLGVARDLAALGAGVFRAPAYATPDWATVPGSGRLDSSLDVRVDPAAREACPVYTAVLLEGLPHRLPDLWRERLRRSGQKRISPLVDWLNVWMVDLGQPMHAFDADRLAGGVQVRWARSGEEFDALDGRDLHLSEDMLVVADSIGPVALAGIIGGRRTAVSSGTRRVLLESAWFSPGAVQGRARRLGIQTEASQRFERGVDFCLAAPAAAGLLTAMESSSPAICRDAVIVKSGALSRPAAIRLRADRIGRILGTRLENHEVATYLGALGCVLEEQDAGWEVVPPGHRQDLRIEADLIEEVARLSGYDRLPARQPRAPLRPLPVPGEGPLPVLRGVLVERDCHEVITYSFISSELQELCYPGVAAPQLQNPLSADMAVMRAGLWPGLLQALQFNRNRQQDRIRIFETGRVFADGQQTLHLAGCLHGPAGRENWADSGRGLDFFDAKGDVSALLGTWPGRIFQFSSCSDPALHPGQSAEISCDGISVGRMGALHPQLAQQFGLDKTPFLFYLRLEKLVALEAASRFHPLSPFPGVRRDLAFTVPEGISAGAVLDAVWGGASALLQEVEVFDRYVAEHLPPQTYSLGLRFFLQDPERTLTDAGVQQEMDRILLAVRRAVPVELRDGGTAWQ